MEAIKQLLHNPMAVLAAYYVASAAISGMPQPDQGSSKGYRWFYTTLHLLAANFSQIATQWRNGGNPMGPVAPQGTIAGNKE
jgi:hypothetical protein